MLLHRLLGKDGLSNENRLCKLQMALTFAFGLWGCLLFFMHKRRFHFGSNTSVVNIRLSILLITTSVFCFLAILGEISYSLGTVGDGSNHRMLGIMASVRMVLLISSLCYFHRHI